MAGPAGLSEPYVARHRIQQRQTSSQKGADQRSALPSTTSARSGAARPPAPFGAALIGRSYGRISKSRE